jgi:surface protein
MFRFASAFNQDLSKWNVSKITNMQAMFQNCSVYNNGADTDVNAGTGRAGLDGWDMSNVTNVMQMFLYCSAFNRPIGNWNTAKVTAWWQLFAYCTVFNQDIGNWNTSSATSMPQIFMGAEAFDQDISKWDVSKATTFNGLFYYAKSFNNGANTNVNSITGRSGLNGWNPCNVTNMGGLFKKATGGTYAFNRPIGDWDVGKCTNFNYCFGTDSVTGSKNPFDQDISAWNIGQNLSVGQTVDLNNMFNCSVFNNGANSAVNPITGRAGLDGWDTSRVTNMEGLFNGNAVFNRPLTNWNTAAVTSFSLMFGSCSSLKQSFGSWNVTAGANFINMFSGADINETGTTTNYDNTLLGWAAQNVQNSKSINFGTSKYSATGLGNSAAGTGKAHLAAALNASPTPGHAWSITDGGLQT